MVRFVSVILALCLLVMPFYAHAEDGGLQYIENKSYYADIFDAELAYLEQLTLECGAVGMYPLSVGTYSGMDLPEVDGIKPEEYTKWPSVSVVPYFSDTAVLGAIRADSAAGTERAKTCALKYINWYISHMNTAESDICGVAGTVYDYHIFQSNDGRTVELTDRDMYASQYTGNSKNPHDYDSTDSYAAMFLQILYEYAKTYDTSFLNDKASVVQTLVDVLMSVYVSDLDLTVAKPNYRACYLMDNCEVYCGFVSAQEIWSELLCESEKAAECASRAAKVKNAILTRMWDKTDKCFRAAVSEDGVSMLGNDLNNFYPQASCQLFPIIFGIIDKNDEKAAIVYERFKNDFGSRWLNFSIETFPWCVLSRAAVLMEDYEFAGSFIEAVNAKYVKRVHKYPYHISESGSVVIAAAYLYALAENGPEDDPGSGPADPGHGNDPDGPGSYITLKCDSQSPTPILTFRIPADLVGDNDITVESLVKFGEDCVGNVYLNLYPYSGSTLLRWTDYATSTLDPLGTWEKVGVTDWDPRKNGISPDKYELGIGFYLATGTVSVAYIKVLVGTETVWYVDFANGIDFGNEYLVKHLNVTPETEGEVWYITVNRKPGDIDGDGGVSSDDAVYLLRHVLFPDSYPMESRADFNGDGSVNSDDAVYLLRHVLFPDSYPLVII